MKGIRASGAPSFAFRHVDMNDLDQKLRASAAQIKIIVTDGVFGQHGDIVPLPYIAKILRVSVSAYGVTSTLPPDQAAAALEALDMVRDEPERRQRLWDNQRRFVSPMQEAGFTLASTATPIVPLHIGNEHLCIRLAAALRHEGMHVDAITFPAIPVGKSRLRFIVNADHTTAQIDRLVGVLERLHHPY